MGVNGDMQKRGVPIYLMVSGVVIYIISLLMPWFTVTLGYILGFHFKGYLFLLLFIYPLYTAIRNVPIHQTYGLFCGIIPVGVLIVLYVRYTGTNDALDVAISKASFGYYTAFIGCVLVLVAIFMKLKRQGYVQSREGE